MGIETGSYDAALTMAGIENYNVVLYSSALPPEATELRDLPDIHHGSGLEGIIAVQHTDRPATRITAGLLLAKVYRKSNQSYLGGFACEYSGHRDVDEAQANLHEAMQQLFARPIRKSSIDWSLGNPSSARLSRRSRSEQSWSALASPAISCRS